MAQAGRAGLMRVYGMDLTAVNAVQGRGCRFGRRTAANGCRGWLQLSQKES